MLEYTTNLLKASVTTIAHIKINMLWNKLIDFWFEHLGIDQESV